MEGMLKRPPSTRPLLFRSVLLIRSAGSAPSLGLEATPWGEGCRGGRWAGEPAIFPNQTVCCYSSNMLVFNHTVWVPVIERLPAVEQMVLVGAPGTMMVAKLDMEGGWRDQMADCPVCLVTCWQHLPDPPPLVHEPMGSPVSRYEFMEALGEVMGIDEQVSYARNSSRFDEDYKVRDNPLCTKDWSLKTVELARALKAHLYGEASPIG